MFCVCDFLVVRMKRVMSHENEEEDAKKYFRSMGFPRSFYLKTAHLNSREMTKNKLQH
jgi:hypothetical protein